MDEQSQARVLVQQLSELEREALSGLIEGESVSGLASRLSIHTVQAEGILDSIKRKLGVTRTASAVRIGLMADARR